jgi:hypothetical protein
MVASDFYELETHISDFSGNVLADEKKKLADADIGWSTFERSRDLTKSNNKKGTALRWIYLIIVFLIFACGTLMALRRKYEYVFIDLLMVIVLSAGIIYIVVLYLDINSRSLTDFDKIRPDASTLVSTEKVVIAPKYGISGEDVSADDGYSWFACNGQSCCFDGTIWNDAIKRCVKPEAFSCMGPPKQNETAEYDYKKVYTAYS